MEWKKYFNGSVLERGLSYYNKDNIKINNSSSKIVEATVYGGNDYNIRIKFTDGEIISMNCDCYYYMHETNCKHLAAVLYYLEDNNEILQDNNVKSILESVKQENINDFILRELERDNDLFIKFKIYNNLEFDENYYLNKIKKISDEDKYFSETMKFIDEDLEFLFENNQFKLILKIIKIIYNNIKMRVDDGEIYGDNDLVFVFEDLVVRLADTEVYDELKEYLKIEFKNAPDGLNEEICNIALRIMDDDELFEEYN